MRARFALAAPGALVPILLATGAAGQPAPIWGGYYNNGVFAAGGGSEDVGHISLQCAGNRLADAGAFHLELVPAARIEPFIDAPPELDFIVDGEIFTLPVTAEEGRTFFYAAEPDDDAQALELIDALRRGFSLVVSAPELDIAKIPLTGSSAALVLVEKCVAEND